MESLDVGVLVDTHCHPTDSGSVALSEETAAMHAVCAMSTHAQDQRMVEELHTAHPSTVIPYYGYHPWWSHMYSFSDGADKREHYASVLLDGKKEDVKRQQLEELLPSLPSPIPFQRLLDDVERRLLHNPRAQVGEVGIDKVFRVKGANGTLSLLQTSVEHQKRVAVAQVRLAKKFGRAVSMHSVSATQACMDVIRDSEYQKIALHSCGIGHNAITYCVNNFPDVHYGFSVAINARSLQTLHESIAVTPSNRILSESDLPREKEYRGSINNCLEIMASVKQCTVQEMAQTIQTNFDKFI
ncbi:hypothetical protein E3P99_02707 [Wallemia hederae]|uniref:Metallo-dependent hydrolase n=1 Tax=Wallemia hederae TaxID=1540922 RepID=A0A4T0FJ99_9BASI|nr:hypothetical protein E3P99_02707 [Wallemia hederae]